MESLLVANVDGMEIVVLLLRNEEMSLLPVGQRDRHEVPFMEPSEVLTDPAYAPGTPYCCSICCASLASTPCVQAVINAALSNASAKIVTNLIWASSYLPLR